MITRKYPSQDILKHMLTYSPETGEFVWVNPTKYHMRVKGKKAGSVRAGGKGDVYVYISVNGKKYPAHQLAWIYMHGSTAITVDHINGNGLDNRACNLRECTHAENMRNHGKQFRQSGMPVGVKLVKGRFQARITYEKRTYHLGGHKTMEQAKSAYINMRNKLFGEFSRKEVNL